MMNKTPIELHITRNFEIRAEQNEDGAIISGRPIVYDSRTDLGWFDEVIERGALDEADLTDVRLLVNHDTKMIPLARSRRNNGNSTMRLTADEFGLSLDFAKLDIENNAEAKSLYSAVNRGDITGMSFMFAIRDEEWQDIDTDHPTRIIKKIESVVEISACTFPAYDSTEIFARSKEALDNARSALENAKATVDTEKKEVELLKLKISII